MKIGLLSDTHGFLDPAILTHFRDCDEIWHGGDIGDDGITKTLAQFKPLRAVYGNIDGQPLRSAYPEDLWFDCEGLMVWMTHIGGTPPRYNPRINKILKEKIPDVFVCGHSHILRAGRDAKMNNLLYLNPGAAGNQGFHTIRTIMRLEIKERKILQVEVIELGKRGQLHVP